MIKGNESLLMQTPLQRHIWLQRYEEYVSAKNKNKSPLLLPVSQKQYGRHPTHSSSSCHIHIVNTYCLG